MKKRVFIAIDLPEEVKKHFTDLFNNIAVLQDVKWEKPKKLHLTLVFLGRVTEKQISQLHSIVESIECNQKPLLLSIEPSVSGFPTSSNPRVLWLPIEGELAPLQAIADELQKRLKDSNFHFDERAFHTHLTIGRFRSGVKKWQKEKVVKTVKTALPKGPIEFKADGLTLFESTLTPKESVYKVIHYANFGDRN